MREEAGLTALNQALSIIRRLLGGSTHHSTLLTRHGPLRGSTPTEMRAVISCVDPAERTWIYRYSSTSQLQSDIACNSALSFSISSITRNSIYRTQASEARTLV